MRSKVVCGPWLDQFQQWTSCDCNDDFKVIIICNALNVLMQWLFKYSEYFCTVVAKLPNSSGERSLQCLLTSPHLRLLGDIVMGIMLNLN